MFSGLFEFFLCGSEDVNFFVLFGSVKFGTFGLLLENNLFSNVLSYIDTDAFEVVVL